MTRLALAALLVARAAAAQPAPAAAQPAPAAAQPAPAAAQPAPAAADHLARVRALYDRGDFAHARDELRAAYQLDPRPELLFALGQVELNLHNYAVAIRYYEQFITTGPAADQIALAQQAIGAARARLAEKPAPPPRPRWDRTDTVIVASGGLAALLGGGLIAYGVQLGGDRGGTLSTYAARVDRANGAEWIGAGCIAAGVLAAGVAIVRWRVHLVDAELAPLAAPHAAGLSWVRRW
jgi:tetratricopeptide (TPR) repeat protein